MGGKFATRHAHAIIRRNPDLAPLRKDHQALDKRVGSSSIKPPRRTRARQRNAMPAAYLDWLATHLDEVDATLFFDEMQEILIFQFGCCYHRSTICSNLIAARYSRHKFRKIAQRQNDYVRSVWRENMAGVDSSRFIFLDETRRFVERAFAFIASSPAPRAATAPSQCSRWTASLGFQSPGPRGLTLELSRTIYAQCYSQF